MVNLLRKLTIFVLLVISVFEVTAIEISSYARVSKNGDSIATIRSNQADENKDQTMTRVSEIEATIIGK